MKIALIGYGVENASAYRYLHAQYPEAEFTVYDESPDPPSELPEGVGFMGGRPDFFDIEADFLVRTPGVSPYKIRSAHPVTSATKLFFDACTRPIIGVTGTKGKGTTCSLIASILRASGRTVWLVGNIGAPALDVLDTIGPDDIVVYELSSFQLWDLTRSPSTAVVLMIESEHLDVHPNVEDYVNAKANIARYQHADDQLVYKTGNRFSEGIAAMSGGIKTAVPNDLAAHVSDEWLCYGSTRIISVADLPLPGAHNIDNALAAIDAVWQWVSDPETVARGLRAFEGLPHRLKFIRTVRDVAYYDDSIATTPGSAIAAIRAFEQPKVLILGGSSKKADFSELAHEISVANVRSVVLIGDEADRIEAALGDAGYGAGINLGNTTMEAAVRASAERAHEGDVVILSPACASFGLFKNYADRGDQFIAATKELA